MKLLVVGAGATGAYYGALAHRGGADVTLFARGAHAQAMQTHGVQVKAPAGDFSVRPRVVTRLDEGDFDLVLVTVKTGDLVGVLPDAARCLAPGGALITAQNGVEVEELAAPHVPAASLVGGVLFIGASVSSPGHIEVRGRDVVSLGAASEHSVSAAERAVAALVAVGVNAKYVPDLAMTRWSKLVWNNAWNSLTALTRLPCATAARHPALRALAESTMREVVAVARAHGVPLPDSIIETQLAAGESVGDIRTSTLQDILAGRPLEWDPLVGVIVRLGARHGVPTPVNAVLAALLAGAGTGSPPKIGLVPPV
jgi:2-dehydropantoate 2-reductase